MVAPPVAPPVAQPAAPLVAPLVAVADAVADAAREKPEQYHKIIEPFLLGGAFLSSSIQKNSRSYPQPERSFSNYH